MPSLAPPTQEELQKRFSNDNYTKSVQEEREKLHPDIKQYLNDIDAGKYSDNQVDDIYKQVMNHPDYSQADKDAFEEGIGE